MCISPTFAIILNRPTTTCMSIDDRIGVSLWNCNRERKYRGSFVHESSPRSFDSLKRPGKKFQVPWSVVEVPRHRLARLKTFVSSSYITIFPRTRTEGERETWRGTGRQEDDARRKREAYGFPVAVNGTSINIPCFSLCSLRFFPNSPPIKFLFTYISLLSGGNKIPTKGLLARICCVHVAKRFISA